MPLITSTVGKFHLTVRLTDEQYELLVKLMKICPELNKKQILDIVYEKYPNKTEEE